MNFMVRLKHARAIPFIAAAAAVATMVAQSPSSTDPAVNYVASVKLNDAVDARTISEYSPGGRLTATAITVGAMLRIAYRIQPYQLVGAPVWIGTKRYDIAAKAEDTPLPSQPVLLRALLRDRFALAIHNETREMPIFALVVARSDGKTGPQLSKSSFDCAAYLAGRHPPPKPGKAPPCGANVGFGTLLAKAIQMTQLAMFLSPSAGRFTVDKTGLAGGFDVELRWTPEQAMPNPAANPTVDAGSPPGPTLYTALQEQLGLKLISDKGPVAVLVIDHIAEPSAN